MNNGSHRDNIKIGDVFLINFSGKENVQAGWRPGIILQNNVGNIYSPNVVAVPLTTSIKKVDQPTHVLISSQDSDLIKDSVALCENPESVPKNSLGVFITRLSEKYMEKIAIANTLASSVISFLNPKVLMSLWNAAVKLNAQFG